MEKYKREIEKYLKYVGHYNFEYAINISLKHKYIYVETPKAGCSTIKDTLQRMELDYPNLIRDNFEDIHLREYSPLLTPSQTCEFDRLLKDPDFFVFCFSRNPYSRLLSAYLDKVVNGVKQKKMVLSAMGEDPSDLSRIISFQDFVDVVCKQSISEMDVHWRVQYYQTHQDHIRYDYIGRLENFQNDCAFVFSRIRNDYMDYFRPEVRHATNANDLLDFYYDDSLKQKVYEKFMIDFEYFNYDEALHINND